MNEEPKSIRPTPRATRGLDGLDRKILGALLENGRETFARIGAAVGLSAPAVHDRVRRLTESGVLRGTTARVDGAKAGKPFLAFVHVETDGWGKGERMMSLREFPEIEEFHSVAGDTCVIIKARAANAEALEALLMQIYALPGVRATKTYVVLSTYLERGVQAEVTGEWPRVEPPLRA
ncbi:MAG: Lrp/AsnC family transcriptional regulator [Pseudomonadota bacterium]